MVGLAALVLVQGLIYWRNADPYFLARAAVNAALLLAVLSRWRHVRTALLAWSLLIAIAGGVGLLNIAFGLADAALVGQRVDLMSCLGPASLRALSLGVGVLVYRQTRRHIVSLGRADHVAG